MERCCVNDYLIKELLFKKNEKLEMEPKMKTVANAQKFTIYKEEGIYLSQVSIVSTKTGLVCAFRRSDQHCATTTDIMIAHSIDVGRTWSKPYSIAHLDWKEDEAIYVAPELNKMQDGSLVLIVDRGVRKYKGEWVSLYHWQKPDLGMSNFVFYSHDDGQSWDGPHQIDQIGGEPDRVHQLTDGSMVYTTTVAFERSDTRSLSTKPLGSLEPYAYYRNVLMASVDGGSTWSQRSVLADDQLYSDVEVGIVEIAPGKLLAVSRCGDMGGAYGQPSRLRVSEDFGQTWSGYSQLPFYGQRPIPGKLQSGRILVTYRNHWGTSGNWAFVFDPEESFQYEPSSFIWEEHRCQIKDDIMVLTTEEGKDPLPNRGTYTGTTGAVAFNLYPVEDDAARVVIEAELRVQDADVNGCCISAGCWIRFMPGRVCLADRPEDGFELDTEQWHRYRIIRDKGTVSIIVDGELKLQVPIAGTETRFVHFGNRLTVLNCFQKNRSISMWKSFSAIVDNKADASISWKWHASQGYPDQFRRDRIVCLDKNGSFWHGNSGYGGWTQTEDGTIVIADYTCGSEPVEATPLIRAYVLREEDLLG
jgi:hypothetical protein